MPVKSSRKFPKHTAKKLRRRLRQRHDNRFAGVNGPPAFASSKEMASYGDQVISPLRNGFLPARAIDRRGGFLREQRGENQKRIRSGPGECGGFIRGPPESAVKAGIGRIRQSFSQKFALELFEFSFLICPERRRGQWFDLKPCIGTERRRHFFDISVHSFSVLIPPQSGRVFSNKKPAIDWQSRVSGNLFVLVRRFLPRWRYKRATWTSVRRAALD
jgi:hypothetical protein